MTKKKPPKTLKEVCTRIHDGKNKENALEGQGEGFGGARVMTQIDDGTGDRQGDEPDFPVTQEGKARVRKVPGS